MAPMLMKRRCGVPALVLGAGVNGLGVVRSLARAGVPVWLADTDLRSAEARTRYARKLNAPTLSGEALIEALEFWARSCFSGQRPVLFLTQEQTVRTVSHYRSRVRSLYRVRLPDAECVEALVTKQGFHRLASTHGAPVPATIHVRDESDLAALVALRFPAVMKPAWHSPLYTSRFRKAYCVDSAEVAAELYRNVRSTMPDMVVQEWIEGTDADIYFCLQYVQPSGEPAAAFVGRKIRSWPPHVGGTASCTSANEVADELERLTTAFFRAVGVTGMASMEFKRDRRTGHFMMIEPTIGRTDYQEEVATLHGVNIPLAAYRDMLGLESAGDRPAPRQRIWRNTSLDRWSAEKQGVTPDHDMPAGAAAVDAYWRWRDPVPGLAILAARLMHRIHRLWFRTPPATRRGVTP